MSFDEGSGVCRNFYGLLSDFQNLTLIGGSESGGFYVRVPKGGSSGRKKGFIYLSYSCYIFVFSFP